MMTKVSDKPILSADEVDALGMAEVTSRQIQTSLPDGTDIFPKPGWLQRHKFLLARFAALALLVVAIIAGVYIGERWPFGEAAEQRKAGQTLLNAWPMLDDKTKATIIKDADRSSKPAKTLLD